MASSENGSSRALTKRVLSVAQLRHYFFNTSVKAKIIEMKTSCQHFFTKRNMPGKQLVDPCADCGDAESVLTVRQIRRLCRYVALMGREERVSTGH